MEAPFISPSGELQMPVPEFRIQQNSKKFLDSISRLKRATGIADHPTQPDKWERYAAHIYTRDKASAEIIAEIFHQHYWGDHGPRYYGPNHGERNHTKNSVTVQKISKDCYEAHVPADERALLLLRDRVNKFTELYIGPTNRGGHSR